MVAEYYQKVLDEKFVGNGEDIYFKPFEETFHFVMFSMIVGMIYPNPKTEKWRIVAIFGYILVMVPATGIVVYDGVQSLKVGEYDNIFRHTIVMGPFSAMYLKMVLMYVYRREVKELLVEMNEYFEQLNSQPLRHKIIAMKCMDKSFLLEKSWSYCVLAGSFSFPIKAICKNIYSTLFDEEPVKYFIHEVRSPFGSNLDYTFYIALFVNTCLASCIYFLNFTGFDGFFVQLIMHLVLRIHLCGEALKDAFKIDDNLLRRNAVRKVIDEHIAICKFMERVNTIFRLWMTVVTCAMVVHISSCVFYLSKGGLPDFEFLSATSAGMLYLYMICYIGGTIQEESEKLSDTFYGCGWERIPDNRCRYLLVFMIARAQKCLQVETYVNFYVNLDLLVRIFKMAYSLFTFLKQT